MATISAKEATVILKQLPEPVSVFNLGGTVLRVYRVKGMHSPYWMDPALKRLFVFSRSSYSRYGTRSEIDEFDAKAAIYMVQATYFTKVNVFEEWLSIRMVPGNGEPVGAGELEIYTYRDRPMDIWVREKFKIEDRDRFWHYIVSSSRMCGIHPYTIEDGQVQTDLSTETGEKHQYTNIAFALIHWCFVADYPDYKYQLVTAIIRDELALKGLRVVTSDKNIVGPLFTPAHIFLGVKPDEIKLNRIKYAYEFPLYWFNMKQLVQLLEKLIEEGKLSEESLFKYIGSRDVTSPDAMRKFGSLLSVDGPIVGSSLNGSKLRELVDEFIEERPSLKITDGQAWNEANLKTLTAAGIFV